MRTFVLSDIHGYYDPFIKMLELIDFSDEDQLYVIGDVIDRGDEGVRLLQDIMKRKNVELFLGNHELMMLQAIRYQRAVENGEIDPLERGEHLSPYELWTHPANGGKATHDNFFALPVEEQEEIEEYLAGLRLIKRIKIGKTSYHISHSYSLSKHFGKELFLKDATPKQAESIVWDSLFEMEGDPNQDTGYRPFGYVADTYIVGHIFTQRLGISDENGRGTIFKSRKYRGYKVIDMDCGMALNNRSSRLGAMQLETGEEFYVPLWED